MNKAILSICDYSGNWSKPFADKGYTVIQVDPDLHIRTASEPAVDGIILLAMTAQQLRDKLAVDADCLGFDVVGILMAPPCTDFTVSGARWWAEKDADGRTEQSLEIIDACLEIKDIIKPDWWVLENPVGRLQKLRPVTLGKPVMYFQPCDYGDAYTKKTGLWGAFSADLEKNEVEPVWYYSKDGKSRGSVYWATLGGKSARTKRLRSMTPAGFSQAFCEAQCR
jgi:hypothetical protein